MTENCSSVSEILSSTPTVGSLKFFLLTTVLALFIPVVIVGNLLVILVVVVCPNLRSITSLFITSLAMADLMVGILVLPFSAANEILNYTWIFGEVWCQIWLAVDVWMCTASIYNLLAISTDRYIAILKPLKYSRLVTMGRAKVAVFGVWTLAFLICFPAVVLHWPKAFRPDQPARCTCSPLGNSPGYIIYSAVGSFFLPMVSIVLIYIPIYRVARQAARTENLAVIEVKPKRSKKESHPLLNSKSTSEIRKSQKLTNCSPSADSLDRCMTPTSTVDKPTHKESVGQFMNKIPRRLYTLQSRISSREWRISKEIRTSKTVAIVTGCFIFCWLGFSIVYLLQAFPFCQKNADCIPSEVFSVVFWLGYANSALNPFIYAVFNRKFRAGFKKLLLCQ